MRNGKSQTNGKLDDSISLNPLNFEEALESLLKIPPIKNKKLTKNKPKEKSKSQAKV